MNFANKIVFVTGASRGIGNALAIAFAEKKAKVVVNYNSSKKEAEKTVKQITDSGGQAIKIKANVSKKKEVDKMVKQIIKKEKKIDILINNAGVVESSSWRNLNDKDWQKVIEVNLKGVFECSRAVGLLMLSQKYGKIINISSLRGLLGAEDIIAYGAAKAGVINLTKSFAKALSPNVNVNCIALGRMNIGMSKTANKNKVKKFSKETLVKRIGNIDDIVKAVFFFASQESSFITGQTLIVDGGMSLKEFT